VINLAYPGSPVGGAFDYTVTYSKGPHQNPQGTLLEGQSVLVKDRMVFDVVKTVKS
jgi:Multiubiquitin